MINVLIADDHAVVRKGLQQIIREQADMTVVGEAVDGPDALAQLSSMPWDVLVLDLGLPIRNGLEILQDARRLYPNRSVLILSMYPEAEFGIRALKAGAAGYLNKGTELIDLVAAIRKVAGGGKYVSETLAERLASGWNLTAPQSPHEMLTNREYDVIRLLAEGKTLSEVALALSLSAKTISTYRARALRKLRLKSNAELMRYVIERNLA